MSALISTRGKFPWYRKFGGNILSHKLRDMARRRRRLVSCLITSVAFLAFYNKIPLTQNTLDIDICLGTVIRGTEWSATTKTASDESVINALRLSALEFGASNMLLLVDKQPYCHFRPTFLRRSRCVEVAHCADPVFGVPTMDCVFHTLLENSKSEFIAFANGDVLFVDDGLLSSAKFLRSEYEHYFLVGRRHLGEGPPAMKKIESQENMRAFASYVRSLPLDSGYAIDYFVTRREDLGHILTDDFPPFIIGAWRWDNFLLARIFKMSHITVVDGSLTVPVLHQITPVSKDHHSRLGANFNNLLAKKFSGEDFWFGTIAFADQLLQLSDSGIYKESQGGFQVLLRKLYIANGINGLDDLKEFRDIFDEYAKNTGPHEEPVDTHLRLVEQFRQDRSKSGNTEHENRKMYY